MGGEEITIDLDLGSLWEKIQKKRNSAAKPVAAEPKPAAKNMKTWDEFLNMVSTQKEGMFFKDMAIGGSKYVDRLKVARDGYLKHWPEGQVPDLDPTPTASDIEEANELKKKGNKLLQSGNAE